MKDLWKVSWREWPEIWAATGYIALGTLATAFLMWNTERENDNAAIRYKLHYQSKCQPAAEPSAALSPP